jgi:peptide/nickel transport system substrate-binding protein
LLVQCHTQFARLASRVCSFPKDTLVVAWAIDDIITMDPAEAFEISAGEVMGNVLRPAAAFDVNDPSKLVPDIAKSWTVSPTARPTVSSSSPA